MKGVIETILKNQGISLNELAKRVDCSSWRLKNCKNKGMDYLNKEQRVKLKSLSKLVSLKIKKRSLIFKQDKKEFLNTESIFNKKSRSGYKIYCKKGIGKTRFWYRPDTRGRIELNLPAKIFLDERFMINLGLSVGDGLNNPGMKNGHYNFVNTNYDLIALNFNWLKEDFRLKEEKIEVYATGSLNCDKKEEKRKLAEALQIKEEKIRFYKRERNKKVGVGIQVSNRIFQELYLQLFPKLKNRILEKGTYRRAFLKGLFAAEGHIKHSIYETIESISFSYNPKTEIKLSRFVRLCLRKEGINAKMEKRGGMIYFCSYEQMVKFYLLGISNLHREKKEKFERLLKKANVSLHLNKDYKAEKREISQLQLSKRWNVCQPTISHYENRKKIGLDLARRVLPERKWRGSIDHIQISNSKIRDKRCIKFIINHLKQV